MSQNWLQDWNEDDYQALEKGILVAKHRLADSGLFTDEALAEMIDRHPDESLTLSTMGHESKTFEWRDGDRNGVAGKDLLETVRNGHLWINCRNVLDHHPEYANLVDSVYNELEANNPAFKAQNRSANLLISSPGAIVHYHVDMPVNMLWHLRGRKRVWVYPPFDHRFASMEVLEKVCAGEWSEDVPYHEELDKYALVYDAEPGQLITWPQLTPHRVTNLEGLNVSLSTEHKNPIARKRLNVHQANHLLRSSFGFQNVSDSVSSASASFKQAAIRCVRLMKKIAKRKQKQFVYPKSFIVDPTAPQGFRLKDGHEDVIVAPHEQSVSKVA